MLAEACKAGAVVGNDISGFADPAYLTAAAGARGIGGRDPHPPPPASARPRAALRRPASADVTAFLLDRAAQAEAAGLAPEQIAIDAGLDLGKTPAMSAVLLRESGVLASLGYTLLLSASNKRFLGDTLELDIDDRRDASLASVAYGVMHGCRIVRVHDVAGIGARCAA